jgi:hypothetical protein
VVISSWMHQDAVWERRAGFDGLRVHRIYSRTDSARYERDQVSSSEAAV